MVDGLSDSFCQGNRSQNGINHIAAGSILSHGVHADGDLCRIGRSAPDLAMEPPMPTFGFPAFSKLIVLSLECPGCSQRMRTIAHCWRYDFHRSLRLRAHRYLVDAEPMEDVVASIAEINAPESCQLVWVWSGWNNGAASIPGRDRASGAQVPSVRARQGSSKSPGHPPTLSIVTGALHAGDGASRNTARPTLAPRMVYAALSLFASPYAATKNPA